MSAAPEVAPSTAHPCWCDPRACASEDGVTYHRAIALEAGGASICLEQVGDEPAKLFTQGLDNQRLGAVAAANLAAQLVRAAALLTAGAVGGPVSGA